MIELLFAVALLLMFAAVLVPVVRGAIRTLSAPPATVAAVRREAALTALRQDAWAAATLAAPSPHELDLTGPDGRVVTWHVGPGPRLDRAEGDAVRRWPGLFPDATAAVDGPAVRFTVPDARGFRGGSLVLPSQLALLDRGTP